MTTVPLWVHLKVWLASSGMLTRFGLYVLLGLLAASGLFSALTGAWVFAVFMCPWLGLWAAFVVLGEGYSRDEREDWRTREQREMERRMARGDHHRG